MSARMVMRLAAVGAALVLPPSVAAAPSEFGTSTIPVVTDDERFALYKPNPGTIVVLDDRRDTQTNIAVDPLCDLLDGARGRFLVSCGTAHSSDLTPLILTASTKSFARIPGEGPSPWKTWTRIGRHWLEGIDARSGHPYRIHVNWRTGRRKDGGMRTQDLDDPRLRRHGPRVRADESYLVDGPYRLREFGHRAGRRRGSVEVRWRRRRMVHRCRQACGTINLGSHMATISEGPHAWALDLRRRRRISWTFDGPLAGFRGVQHTVRYVYFSQQNDNLGPVRIHRQTR
jgi:hypothetical protein